MKNYYEFVPGENPNNFIENYSIVGDKIHFYKGKIPFVEPYTEENVEIIERRIEKQNDLSKQITAGDNMFNRKLELTNCFIKDLSKIALLMLAVIISAVFLNYLPFILFGGSFLIYFSIEQINTYINDINLLTELQDDMDKHHLFIENKDELYNKLSKKDLPYIKLNRESLEKLRTQNNDKIINYHVLDGLSIKELKNILEYIKKDDKEIEKRYFKTRYTK